MAKWALKDARDQLDAIAEAAKDGPQEIALEGGAEVLVITRQSASTPRVHENLVEFFRTSPLSGLDLGDDLRPKDPPREIEL